MLLWYGGLHCETSSKNLYILESLMNRISSYNLLSILVHATLLDVPKEQTKKKLNEAWRLLCQKANKFSFTALILEPKIEDQKLIEVQLKERLWTKSYFCSLFLIKSWS